MSGVQAITGALLDRAAPLTELSLGCNKLTRLRDDDDPHYDFPIDIYTGTTAKYAASGVNAVCEMLKVNTVLTSLDLVCTNLNAESGKVLASALNANQALTHLDVSCNSDIDSEAAQQLAAAALSSKSLKLLSGVPIGKSMHGDRWTELSLPERGLGQTEAIVLAEFIKRSTALTSLDLRGNKLGTASWCAIFDVLRNNKESRLQVCNFSNVGLNNESAAALT
eukprot:7182361-Prymnesium_polylepis.1